MEYCDLSSGDESDSDLDLGLFRAASNCGPETFFAMDSETRSQYRSYDRVRHRVRKGKPQKPKKNSPKSPPSPPMAPVYEEDEEDEEAEPADAEDEEEDAEEVDLSRPLSPLPQATVDDQQSSKPAAAQPQVDERGVPLLPNGKPDKAALWQRYRKLARQQLVESNASVKSANVNSLAREWYVADGWAPAAEK